MDEQDYPSNSRRIKKEEAEPEQRRVDRVVEGVVVRRKPPLHKRFIRTFFGADDAKEVATHVVTDVMVPAMKDMITDTVSQAIERALYGEVRGGRARNINRGGQGYTNYTRYSSSSLQARDRRDEPRRELSNRARTLHEFDEIIIPTRAEAEDVRSGLFDCLAKFETVTVADLYDLLNLRSEYTDRSWGWTDLRGTDIVRVKGGYLLDITKPISLD